MVPTEETTKASEQKQDATAPAITLPKGGGAIRGMGEKFAANPVTGTGSMSIPIASSPGRSGFGPQLSLSYDSGAGNGPFGFGYHLSSPGITRKTDKGLPKYRDTEESDVFILSGAEDLVPELAESNCKWERKALPIRTVGCGQYRIQRYRPRIEGLFARIERWTNQSDPSDTFWRSITRDNLTTWYGKTPESRITDPADPTRIFTWLICESYDDKGNVMVYRYKAENADGLDLCQANERNRSTQSRSANRYLKRILYGNRKPFYPSLKEGEPTSPLPCDWFFEVVFDYGEHHPDSPTPSDTGIWTSRNDPFSTYRSGYEVRTYRLCQRVLMFHHFPDEPEVGTNCLVRSTDFNYSYEEDPSNASNPIFSFLLSATQSGYKRLEDGSYFKKSLPPLEFEYTQPKVCKEIHEVDSKSLENLPYGLEGSRYQWVDLDGEGLSGILSQQGDQWFYKRNLSPINVRSDCGKSCSAARFGPVELIAKKPSLAAIDSGRQQLLDLAGDGQLDLVELDSPTPGFYERTHDEDWDKFAPFISLPVLDWSNPNLKFIDLTGDGHADILISEDDAFCWHASLAEAGFAPAQRVHQMLDEEKGPRLVFSDSTESIFLADLSGDGLTDLVRIRNGEVCYWPNIGYGRFGTKVRMDASPWFESPDLFDQRRIRLADIDGSGVTDIIYLGSDGVHLYFNQSGNSWSKAHKLAAFPVVDNISSVQVTDLLGNGTACLVWSSPLPVETKRCMRYVDLMGGEKPHLLVKTVNNLGAETHVRYAPSIRFYLQDKIAGKPWITKIPFPIHVVERVETYDRISRNRFVTRYAYHHGYFDGVEREFRGFGMVEQWDTEEFATLSASGAFPDTTNIDQASHLPPVLTKTWFHTGAYREGGQITRQFEHEYWLESDASDDETGLSEQQARAMLLDDTLLPNSVRKPNGMHSPVALTEAEKREACRALKGSILRQEVYALDGTDEATRPYSASERNYTIEFLQPRGENKYAVFFSHARETIDFQYERKLYDINIEDCQYKLADPHVTHAMTLAVDDFGNVLQSVAIAYGRRHPELDSLLSDTDKEKQQQTHITYSENRYTNSILQDDNYRTPLPCESKTFEILKAIPCAHLPLITNLFRHKEMRGLVELASDGKHDIPYEDVEASRAIENHSYRRCIQYVRTLYRANNLENLLPFGELQSLALTGESYKLAFTLGLPAKLYGDRLNFAMFDEGGYVHDEIGWWIPSGRLFYSSSKEDSPEVELDYTRQHFFIPLRFHNPFDGITRVTYDHFDLLTIEMRDAVGNLITAGVRDKNDQLVASSNDYRVLQPLLVMDANRNRAAVAFDTLGMVVGTAVMGKPEEHLGDSLNGFLDDPCDKVVEGYLCDPLADPYSLLQDATTRIVYDLFAYWRTRDNHQPQPPMLATLSRETHVADLAEGQQTKIQHSFSYSDGFGREIQKKAQAEPGQISTKGEIVSQRWIGSGWTIYNNKGKPVRQYEPFFSANHEFEFAAVAGVSAVIFYDPIARVIATLHPNDTWEKVVFDPWHQETWDVNDTILTDPRDDVDVGGYVDHYLDSQKGWQTWYEQRIGGAKGRQEQLAAEKAAVHANTPTQAWLDSLGRSMLAVAHNRLNRNDAVVEEYYTSRRVLDIEGNQLEIVDALGRSVMRYAYDMLGNAHYQTSIESGTRWNLNDVGNSPIYTWNSRGFRIHMEYDDLRRPIRQWVQDANGQEFLAERTVYGEAYSNASTLNLRGKSYYQFDGAGVVRHDKYDFKGNLLGSTRRLVREYRQRISWIDVESLNSNIQLDIEALENKLASLLENEELHGETTYDANNRPVTLKSPDDSIAVLTYNEANLLERLDVKLHGAEVVTPFIINIDYNARGQRQAITHGNNTFTSYKYDPLTFRLIHLETLRGNSALQDFQYTYDPAGNITSIEDGVQTTVHFNNAVVSANTDYLYDAVYQLISATGREHIGLASAPQSNWDDGPRIHLPHCNDGSALRRYSEQYQYDPVGNLLELIHATRNGNWRRGYEYTEQSLLEPNRLNNRLSTITVGDVTEAYHYDEHGNTISMSHLSQLDWDHEDQLKIVELGGGGRAYYQYDTAGRRVRKVIERQNGSRQKERVYVGGYEVYREFSGDGETIKLERRTLHIIEDKKRIALVETKTVDSEFANQKPAPLIRYQLSNHLDSTALELDETGAIISYEEYYPFGGTSFQSGRSAVEVSQKRYRFTGKERDEETGFYYHGARYYAPWLSRWISCDPAGLVDGSNIYRYVKNNPINATDPTGMWEMPSWRTVAVIAAVVVVGTIVTVATAGAAGPLVVGAVASIGLTGTAATVATGVAVGAIAGAVGGAAAGAAGEGTRQTVNSRALGLGDQEFSGGRVLSAAAEGAESGAKWGAAIGGGAALVTSAAGTAAIGAVGRMAQRAAPTLSKGAISAARGVGNVASTVARTPGVRQIVQGVKGVHSAAEELGIRAARGVFQSAQSATGGSIGLTQAAERGAAVIERFATTRSFAASFETMTVYRGSRLTAEIGAHGESGYLMSDAARTAYLESRYAGSSVSASLRSGHAASEAAHANQLATWGGSSNEYVQAHGAFGTELNVFGQRSLVSTTTDPARATYFAGQGGSVFQTNVLKAQTIPQTLTGATESEFLVPHMLRAKVMP